MKEERQRDEWRGMVEGGVEECWERDEEVEEKGGIEEGERLMERDYWRWMVEEGWRNIGTGMKRVEEEG